MNLKANVPSRAALYLPDVQPHAHTKLTNLLRPIMCSKVSQRSNRRSRPRCRILESSDESIAGGALYEAALCGYRIPHQRVMIGPTPAHEDPNALASRVEPSISVNSIAIVPSGG